MSTFADIFKMMLRQPVTVAVFPSALIEPIVELNVAKTVTSSGVTDGCGNDRRFTFGESIQPSIWNKYNKGR